MIIEDTAMTVVNRLARAALVAVSLMTLSACGGADKGLSPIVKACVEEEGEWTEICTCRAAYVQENTPKEDFDIYVKYLSAPQDNRSDYFDGLGPEEAQSVGYSIGFALAKYQQSTAACE